MILERLVIRNFRQFKGEHEIIFSDNREKNVTLIHAENGFGKTTLLNAILWALYGHRGLTPDFEGKEYLIHNGLAHSYRNKPSELEAMVHLTFTHDGARYMLSRALNLAEQKVDPKKDRMSLETLRDGQTFNLDRPQHRIQAIIPEGISKFLFFNGERIDELGLDKNRGQVTEAIHQMLGLNLLQSTIDDLNHNNVRGKFRKELADKTSDEKRDLIDQQAKQEKKKEQAETKLSTAQEEIQAIDNEIVTIEAKLAANKETHELQAKRAQLQRQKAELGARADGVNKRLTKLIAEDGYTLFTTELVAKGKAIMKDLRSKNQIPAPVLDTFLQQLLDEGICICERCLEPGSDEYEAVKKKLSNAPNQDFNNAVSALDHAVGILEGVAETTRDNLQQLTRERVELTQRIRAIEGELDDIHQKVGSKDDEKVKELEESRRAKALKRDELTSRCGSLKKEIEITAEAISKLQNQIRKMEDQEEKAMQAQRRVDAVEECTRVISELLQAETEELRPLLNDEISEHFSKIIDRDYRAELSEDYDLRIRSWVGDADDERVEQDVALSTGQRQVKLLVFIASLLALAKRRSEIPTILRGLSGSEYPLVTDAPFGNISVFRAGISRWVPNLAPQVTILLTPSQYDGDVEKALRETGRVAKRYYLAYHGPENSLRQGANATLTIEGKEYQQYFSSDEEFTEIKEL
jgi:DNA sulfur modification protein DndD